MAPPAKRPAPMVAAAPMMSRGQKRTAVRPARLFVSALPDWALLAADAPLSCPDCTGVMLSGVAVRCGGGVLLGCS
jgi:hypothetical protein